MICNIIFRSNCIYDTTKSAGRPEIIHVSDNFYECLSEFENIALDTLCSLAGNKKRRILKKIDYSEKFCCVGSLNKLVIMERVKGWVYNYFVPKYTYEFIYYRIPTNGQTNAEKLTKDKIDDMDYKIELHIELLGKIAPIDSD